MRHFSLYNVLTGMHGMGKGATDTKSKIDFIVYLEEIQNMYLKVY